MYLRLVPAIAMKVGLPGRQLFAVSTLLAGATIALLSGCATAETARDHAWRASAPQLKTVFTPTPSEAATLAAQEHEGDFALTGIGESMQPRYNPGTALVVHPTSYFMLRAGMPVVYSSRNGHSIAHVLLEETSRGWVAIGLNNSEPDDELVTPGNLLGVVTCAYVPALSLPDRLSRPTYAFAETTGTLLLH